jgi:hypothetical protein
LSIPGKCELDMEKSTIKEGVVIEAIYKYEDSVQQMAERMSQIMIDTETEFFAAAGSPLIGRVDWSVAPYWKH